MESTQSFPFQLKAEFSFQHKRLLRHTLNIKNQSLFDYLGVKYTIDVSQLTRENHFPLAPSAFRGFAFHPSLLVKKLSRA